jgi:hypothetical protein
VKIMSSLVYDQIKEWKDRHFKNVNLDWVGFDRIYFPICTMSHWMFLELSINNTNILCTHYNSIPQNILEELKKRVTKLCNKLLPSLKLTWTNSTVSIISINHALIYFQRTQFCKITTVIVVFLPSP